MRRSVLRVGKRWLAMAVVAVCVANIVNSCHLGVYVMS